MTEYKQVILVRKDLKLSKGKMATQVGHASVEGVLKSDKDDVKRWKDQGMKKAVLKVADLTELMKYKEQAEDAGLVTGIIVDAGRTELAPGTVTCIVIGPDKEEKIDKITGKLPLM
jgi:PTH2 family peptidyl-tRNA hydrolase